MAFRPCAFVYAVSGGRPWPALTDGGPTLQSGAGAPLPSRHDAGWVAPVALSPSWVPALLTPSSLLRALFSGRCSAPQPVASRPAWSNPGGPRSGRSPCMLLGLSWLPARSHFHRPRVAYSGRTLFAAHLPIVEAGKTTCRVTRVPPASSGSGSHVSWRHCIGPFAGSTRPITRGSSVSVSQRGAWRRRPGSGRLWTLGLGSPSACGPMADAGLTPRVVPPA